MVTTRQSARNARQNSNTLQEEAEEDAEPQPTHTTSLTPKELRLIHQLCRFRSNNPHHAFKPELKRHLYRFACFMPAPYGLRTPSAWNSASWRDPPDAPLPKAVAKALVLLRRPVLWHRFLRRQNHPHRPLCHRPRARSSPCFRPKYDPKSSNLLSHCPRRMAKPKSIVAVEITSK